MEDLKKYAQQLTEMKDDIWRYAELSYQEFKSVAVQKKMLEEHGFKLTHDVAGLPTSFMAEYGSGSPVIAILGEFDALPGLSQKAVPHKDPVEEGGNGHGCGHCLIAPGCIGAALVVKDAMDRGEVKGTVRYYACPAEEGGSGKGFMVREGAFEGVDAALFWHPEPVYRVSTASMLAVACVEFTFHGVKSYASTHAHMGRSALDAVELMNVSTNYLREHVPEDARLHYTITNGGENCAFVPETASVAYMVRGKSHETLDDVLTRVTECAEGAAIMTDTTYTMKYHSASDALIPNITLARVVWEKMHEAGPTQFDEADEAFARASVENYPEAHKAEVKYITDMSGIDVTGQVLSREILDIERLGLGGCIMGSSDLGDVSQVVPTTQFNVASAPIGSPAHTWSNTSAYGSILGTKGMLKAAEIMALTSLELLKNEAVLQAAKDEFIALTKDNPYRPLMPTHVTPPICRVEDVYPDGLGLS